MSNKNKPIDPLPDLFASEAEAGEFWDSHSTMDYAEYLEPTNDVIKIKKRVFEVQVEEDVFQRWHQEALAKHKTIPKVVDQILRKTLPVTYRADPSSIEEVKTMSITITIPAELEPLILRQAKATGKPVEEVTVELIAQGLQPQPPALTFDEILAPFRKEVAESSITDEELEALVLQARRDFARENQEQN